MTSKKSRQRNPKLRREKLQLISDDENNVDDENEEESLW